MKAIIPAAGLGTRFLPVTRVVPKEMLPIGAKPALELIVDEAKRAGVDEVVIVVSRAKELVRRYFEGDPQIRFAVQEEQRGLGHAVLQAGVDDDCLVLLGDALVLGCDASSEMVARSRELGGAAVIGCERVPREKTSRYGILATAPDGRIVDMVEKPAPEEAPSDIAVAGRYLLPKLLATHPVYAYEYPGRRQDIGNPDGYFAALEAFRRLERTTKGT